MADASSAVASPSLLPPVAVALMREVARADAAPDLVDNVDTGRFPNGPQEPPDLEAPDRLGELLRQSHRLQLLYDLLAEPADRELLVRVLAFRVLGHRKVEFPLTAQRLRELNERAYSVRTAERSAQLPYWGWYADDYDLTALGFPVRLRARVGGVVCMFELEMYRCPGTPSVEVRPGDVVIDGGGCLGDSALYFSHLAGSKGRVLSFEFEPGNLQVLEQNLGMNPKLAPRIEVMRAALWDHAGEQVSFRSNGPGTAIEEGGAGAVSTESIDALVERDVVKRVDFIKLDIEGSELNALRGAEATLRRFRPRLAISAYHKPDDLVTIPEYLHGLDVGYQFRLGHFTIHGEETVLFATAGDAAPPRPRRRLSALARRFSRA
jgi:FkbM family methyltransferase